MVQHAEADFAGLRDHPHARAVLSPVVGSAVAPSHAYLFHGPAGTGKRAAARELAAWLIADGEVDPDAVAARVRRGAHPDVTWVTPSGSASIVVADIDGPVVAAATRTPFEARRRVFVIESADTMNDEAAARLLKTLEEPASFVHLVLVADRPQELPDTIRSRCQAVRFDPLPADLIAAGLPDVDATRAQACARLALGDARMAAFLSSDAGERLRAAARELVRAAFDAASPVRAGQSLLDQAAAAAERAEQAITERLEQELPLLPKREQGRARRELQEACKRAQRRARTETLEAGLRLVELWLRDVLCIIEGAGDLVHAVDRRVELEADAAGRTPASLREAIELVGETRADLRVNVGEELAVEALVIRLRRLLA
ncbi:MAG TPA: hypothetical protein VMA83_02065 [Solirubrobacteraceae bacterium]|nr:hypothetical protein [Solirubrobacteraceae bacterium]